MFFEYGWCLRMDRINNVVVKQRISVAVNFVTSVGKNVLRWFGRVERMEAESVLEKMVNVKLNEGFAKKRPRLRWV